MTTKINVSENLNLSGYGEGIVTHEEKAQAAQQALEQGFITGANHVHNIIGIMLLTWALQLGIYGLVKLRPDLFESQEAADEFFVRTRRSLETGRVVMALFLFQKTVFTFAMNVPAGVLP